MPAANIFTYYFALAGLIAFLGKLLIFVLILVLSSFIAIHAGSVILTYFALAV